MALTELRRLEPCLLRLLVGLSDLEVELLLLGELTRLLGVLLLELDLRVPAPLQGFRDEEDRDDSEVHDAGSNDVSGIHVRFLF